MDCKTEVKERLDTGLANFVCLSVYCSYFVLFTGVWWRGETTNQGIGESHSNSYLLWLAHENPQQEEEREEERKEEKSNSYKDIGERMKDSGENLKKNL